MMLDDVTKCTKFAIFRRKKSNLSKIIKMNKIVCPWYIKFNFENFSFVVLVNQNPNFFRPYFSNADIIGKWEVFITILALAYLPKFFLFPSDTCIGKKWLWVTLTVLLNEWKKHWRKKKYMYLLIMNCFSLWPSLEDILWVRSMGIKLMILNLSDS